MLRYEILPAGRFQRDSSFRVMSTLDGPDDHHELEQARRRAGAPLKAYMCKGTRDEVLILWGVQMGPVLEMGAQIATEHDVRRIQEGKLNYPSPEPPQVEYDA